MKKQNNSLILSIVSLTLSLVCLILLLGHVLLPGEGGEAQSAAETTTQYVMYVGTNDKDTYQPEHTPEEARAIVDQVCLSHFEGYTLQEATGAWTDETGEITHEYSLVCYFDGADRETVYKAADDIIKALNQNTVLIEQDEISMEYYSGN